MHLSSHHRPLSILAVAGPIACLATPAFAQATTIDPADTAWMITATALVLMMTMPGLALFYAGMVRKKNVLATMAQSLAALIICSLLWMVIGYSLTFTGEGPVIGSMERFMLRGMAMDSVHALAKSIPEALFMIYQMTFAIITVALVSGSVAERMRFSAFAWFCVGWLLLVYVPIAHWVWGADFSALPASWILPADLSCILIAVSQALSRPACSARDADTVRKILRPSTSGLP